MEGWIPGVRYAARSLAGARKFSALVVATLALGIGANTAVFGVLNAVVLNPLPYEDPERLVRVYKRTGPEDNQVAGVLPDAFRDPVEPDVEIWTPVNLQPGDSNSWDNNRGVRRRRGPAGRRRHVRRLDSRARSHARRSSGCGSRVGGGRK